MSVKEIVTADPTEVTTHEVLSATCRQVLTVSEEVRALVYDLQETMHAHSICVGLAAPQIGSGLRIAVVNASEGKSEPDLLLIDPVLESATGKKDVKNESCMSLPGWMGKVERRKKIVVSFLNINGEREQLAVEGFLARVIQHELDHLDGVLYPTRLISGSSLEGTNLFDADS